MNGDKTGFKDMRGKSIHYGDIVQIGQTDTDQTRREVVRDGVATKLLAANEHSLHHRGYALTKQHCQFLVVVDHHHKPFI